jgi:hypothetical protein
MAQTDLSGFNGAVTMPSGHGGAAKGFTVRRTTTKKSTLRYGNNRFSQSRLGIITIGGDISIFMRMGTAAVAPGIVTNAADGTTLTLTFEIGCTLSGTAVFPDWNSTHAFEDPAIEATLSYEFTGTVTETWATS